MGGGEGGREGESVNERPCQQARAHAGAEAAAGLRARGAVARAARGGRTGLRHGDARAAGSCSRRALGLRIHCGLEVTESSTKQQWALLTSLLVSF